MQTLAGGKKYFAVLFALRGALRLEEEEIPNKFEIGFRGRSDGDLNKAFSRGSSATDPIFCKSSSATERKILGQVLSQPLLDLVVAISVKKRRHPLTTGQKRCPSQIKRA